MDNMDRDKQLNTRDIQQFSETINPSHVFLKLYKQTINLLQYLLI